MKALVSAAPHPVRLDSPRLWQLRNCLRSNIASRQRAKCSLATLGETCSMLKHSRAFLNAGLIPKPVTPLTSLSRSYRFGTPKPAKSSGPPKPSSPAKAARSAKQAATPGLDPVRSHILDSASWATITALGPAKNQVFSQADIPSEHNVLTFLLQCSSAAGLATGAHLRQVPSKTAESDTAASSLLSLDGTVSETSQRLAVEAEHTWIPTDGLDQISQVAFEVIVHPRVIITPQVLEAYISLQGRLGKPETLPHVLELYASKPRPRTKGAVVELIQQNPDKASKALDPAIIEKALDVAIEAKNLDAAVGIIESTYATTAFIRQKLLRKALLPISAAASAPLAVYLLASKLAQFQSSYDQKTATVLASLGFLAYIGLTGSLGLTAALTHNDHMKRVTWAPGVRLRERWLHEEQRAALDKVACSFGFSQPDRFGEEEGAEFLALRQFVLTRGMILDRVELMEGMG